MPNNQFSSYQPSDPALRPGGPDGQSVRNLFSEAAAQDPAVNMIRQKLDSLYADEPDAKQEIIEAKQHTHPGSKHQQFMAGLQSSGQPMATIQAAWHAYYAGLPDTEKHEVWQEFYAAADPAIETAQAPQKPEAVPPAQAQPQPEPLSASLRQRSAERQAGAASGAGRHGKTPTVKRSSSGYCIARKSPAPSAAAAT